MLLACIVEITEVCGGEILALREVLLLLLAFGADVLDDYLGIFVDSRVACIGALNDVNSIFKERPWVRSSATIAMKRASIGCIGLVRAIVVVAAVAIDGFLGLTGLSLCRESLTTQPTNFTGNGPDILYSVLAHKADWSIS